MRNDHTQGDRGPTRQRPPMSPVSLPLRTYRLAPEPVYLWVPLFGGRVMVRSWRVDRFIALVMRLDMASWEAVDA